MAFKCMFSGLLLPLFGESEKDWPNIVRLILYLMGLGWTFLGVAVISDVFMAGIEKITSSKKRVKDKDTGRTITVYVWNATVANLTLMALGSSAPEILLSLIEITSDEFFLGPLGAGTIVGSAAFNLLIISAVCVVAIPDGEVRYVKQVPVYVVTASCSVLAYMWLMLILKFVTPDVTDLWEAVLTLLFCPILVLVAYLADRGYFSGKSTDYKDGAELDAPDQTIPDDVTDAELVEIEKKIRADHGANLTQDQVIKIMKVQYFNKHSRAYYRHSAMEATIKRKSVDQTHQPGADMMIQEAIACTDDVEAEKQKKIVRFDWKCDHYAFAEGVGTAKISVIRTGPTACKAFVNYITKEGTAKPVEDYEHIEGTLTFEKDEVEKLVGIVIKDDDSYENDENFTVELSGARCDEGSSCEAKLAGNGITTLTVVDDDLPGELRFKVEEMDCTEEGAPIEVAVLVERYNGARGAISCQYKTENMAAVAGVDYEATEGTIELADSQQSAKVVVTVNARGRNKDAQFNMVLLEPTGTKFDPKTDGGEDQCICHVNIKGMEGAEGGNILSAMKDRVQSANAIVGQRNWGQQFKDALFQVGDEEEEGEEEGEDAGPKAGPGKFDYFMHFLSLPWKLLFAFVPPTDYCGGWACFFGALVMIGVVTAIVGDMANLVGCCLDILPETAAITFVALGTSLPDTFASKTAAIMDPYADASIGNVTGSNSINVFMGIGIAWCIAAVYWQTHDITEEWQKRFAMLAPKEQANVLLACDPVGVVCTKAVFITPGGTIWFNLMVFCINAFFALQHLYARRKRFGGELGGPKKGLFGQYFSASFLMFQWFIYVVASIVFARMQDAPVSYGMLALAAAA